MYQLSCMILLCTISPLPKEAIFYDHIRSFDIKEMLKKGVKKFTALPPLFNSLWNNKILDLSKLKAFAYDKINVIKKLKWDLGWVENSVRKRENAGFSAFSPFLTMYSKNFFLGVIKSRDCAVNSSSRLHHLNISFCPLQVLSTSTRVYFCRLVWPSWWITCNSKGLHDHSCKMYFKQIASSAVT